MTTVTTMSSKQRMVTALKHGPTDRLPVTTHHIMPSFLDRYMPGTGTQEFFDYFGFDPITWVVEHRPDPSQGEYADPEQGEIGFLEARRVSTDNWRIHAEEIPGQEYPTVRYRFVTPKGELSMVLQSNPHTSWVAEYLIKNKRDIDLLAEFMTAPKCDVEAANKAAEEFGDRGLVRSHICCFDVFGQPGTFQDAACITKIEDLIYASYDDPEWLHELLRILQRRKKTYIESLKGARFDIHELGGGSASSTVISPKMFEKFVAPYDKELIDTAHRSDSASSITPAAA